jgi:LPXTG-site transpeptidase (sortase) family protein
MRVVHPSGTVRRGLLALVLALLALVLAPGAPAGSPSAVATGWSDSWSQSWNDTSSDLPLRGTEAKDTVRKPTPRTYVTGVPVSLRIPRLDVATDVVAVNADAGVLVPPADPALVGWWAGGARPGSPDGAVVITGHTVHSGDGVFDDLAVLQPDDLVQVTTARGTLTYAVVAVRDLSKAQLASASSDLFAATGRSRVVLVTCTDWDDGEYLGNTVVVGVPTDPVGSNPGHGER